MKRCVIILLAILLLSACGIEKQSPTPSGSSPVSAPESSPVEPERSDPSAPEDSGEGEGGEGSIPQADVALVREIVFAYGAVEDTYNYDQPTIVMKKKSLFIRDESWSGENGLALDWYLYWEDSLPSTDEEWAAIEAGQQYAEEHQGESPFGYGYLGPGEMVEQKILEHFEVTLDYLHSDPEYYDDSIPGYFYPAGGGMGERPIVSFTFQQDGEILTIPVTLTSPSGYEPEQTHTLTVRLEPDGGWKFLGCQVA